MSLFFLSLVMKISLSAAVPLEINQNEISKYWQMQSIWQNFGPGQKKLADAKYAYLSTKGDVYLTVDYTINTNGDVVDLVVIKIEPPGIDPKPFTLPTVMRKYKPAAGVPPTEVRVRAERLRQWIPKD